MCVLASGGIVSAVWSPIKAPDKMIDAAVRVPLIAYTIAVTTFPFAVSEISLTGDGHNHAIETKAVHTNNTAASIIGFSRKRLVSRLIFELLVS
jgi:hypothetical protein